MLAHLSKLGHLAICLLLAVPVAGQNISGYWTGTLNAPGQTLTIGFDIKSDESGTLSASMDVKEQGAWGFPANEVSFENGILKISIAQIGAEYRAMFLMKAFNGTFTQMGAQLPLVLAPGERPKFDRPQEPQPPFPYRCEEVTFTNVRDGFDLAGTLTVPEGDGPFPGVVLVSGSGQQNRDEELMGHKPFAVIADYLTRHGIAVLRFDDRGVGGSAGDATNATTYDNSFDAEAAFDFLKKRPEVSKAGILGHSEGGSIAYMLGARRPDDIAFIISLAGPAVKGSDCLFEQQKAIYKASGLPEPQSLVMQSPNTWMKYFLDYDPEADISAIKCPLLFLNGTLDLQVLSYQNIPAMRNIVSKYGLKGVEIHEFEGLNHLFQHAGTGNPTEYASISETISEEILQLICKWIAR